ncbi:MAG: hypothetical protein ACRCTQ_03555 [Brevinemataceae bacterium]
MKTNIINYLIILSVLLGSCTTAPEEGNTTTIPDIKPDITPEAKEFIEKFNNKKYYSYSNNILSKKLLTFNNTGEFVIGDTSTAKMFDSVNGDRFILAKEDLSNATAYTGYTMQDTQLIKHGVINTGGKPEESLVRMFSKENINWDTTIGNLPTQAEIIGKTK